MVAQALSQLRDQPDEISVGGRPVAVALITIDLRESRQLLLDEDAEDDDDVANSVLACAVVQALGEQVLDRDTVTSGLPVRTDLLNSRLERLVRVVADQVPQRQQEHVVGAVTTLDIDVLERPEVLDELRGIRVEVEAQDRGHLPERQPLPVVVLAAHPEVLVEHPTRLTAQGDERHTGPILCDVVLRIERGTLGRTHVVADQCLLCELPEGQQGEHRMGTRRTEERRWQNALQRRDVALVATLRILGPRGAAIGGRNRGVTEPVATEHGDCLSDGRIQAFPVSDEHPTHFVVEHDLDREAQMRCEAFDPRHRDALVREFHRETRAATACIHIHFSTLLIWDIIPHAPIRETLSSRLDYKNYHESGLLSSVCSISTLDKSVNICYSRSFKMRARCAILARLR